MMRCYKCFGIMKLQGSVLRCPGCGAVMDPVETDAADAPPRPAGPAVDLKPVGIIASLVAVAAAVGVAVYFLPDLIRARAPGETSAPPASETLSDLDERDLTADDDGLAQAFGGWTKVLAGPGGEALLAVDVTASGDIFAAIASTDGATLVRMNDTGDVFAHRDLPEIGDADAVAMHARADGEVVLVGRAAGELIVHHLDAAGASLWTRSLATHGGDDRLGVAAEPAGRGIVVAGPGEAEGEVRLASIGASGGAQWQALFPIDRRSSTFGVASDGEGGAYLAHYEPADAGNGAGLTLRLVNGAGEMVWRREVSAPAGAELAGVAPAGDGGVYVAIGGLAPTLTRFDRRGIEMWRETLPPTAVDAELRAAPAIDGVFIGATYRLSGADSDIWLARFNDAGGLAWDEYPRIPGDDWLVGLAATRDGGVVAGGALRQEDGTDTDVFVHRSTGEPLAMVSLDVATDEPADVDALPLAPADIDPPVSADAEDIGASVLFDEPDTAEDVAPVAPPVLRRDPVADVAAEIADEAEAPDNFASFADAGEDMGVVDGLPLEAPAGVETLEVAVITEPEPAPAPADEAPIDFDPAPVEEASASEPEPEPAPAPEPEPEPAPTSAREPERMATHFQCTIECVSEVDFALRFPLNQTYTDQEPALASQFAAQVKADMLSLCLALDERVNMDADPVCEPQ